ncbi:MAG: DUF3137 domain-containing protein [Geminicoccaceae bacterium]
MSATSAALERRRRRTLRWALGCALLPVITWPLALRFGEGSETRESIAGASLWAGLLAMFAVPFILGGWRRFMARTLLDALVAGRNDVRHIDGERRNEAAVALASPACDLGALAPAGLVEAFVTVNVDHVLTGTSDGVPFALADLRLYNQEGFEVFAGVVGGFGLHRACPGLTIVTRERGLLGNLIASLGSGIERVRLEDPVFERRFEVYGTDQVWSRTVLTTSMLERLLRLDEVAHASGFRCAFVGERLLIALSGMHWRAPLWRLAFPLRRWLDGYRSWLAELVALPAAVVRELALAAQVPNVSAVPVLRDTRPWTIAGTGPEPLRGKLARLLAGIGMPAIFIASGTLFGGLSLYFGYWVFGQWGVPASGGWQIALMIVLGVLYGVFAILRGIVMLARLAWSWNAPLRNLRR